MNGRFLNKVLMQRIPSLYRRSLYLEKREKDMMEKVMKMVKSFCGLDKQSSFIKETKMAEQTVVDWYCQSFVCR